MKFGTDIRGSERMNPNDFGDPLAFYVAPRADQTFHLSSEISAFTAWIGLKFCTDGHGSQMTNSNPSIAS